mmetsp:Transcript_17620/g.30229  ORF Transcript_17620/g.30229 Transcript_17620/m.30229 type:complete len:120 (+) Transcript_17620:3-362(+)
MKVLRDVLPKLLAEQQPQLVMYNAGVDVHGEDQLGKMALTNQGIHERDHFVLSSCAHANVPVAAAIGGGYQTDHAHIVERHMSLHRCALDLLPVFLSGRDALRRGRHSPGMLAVERDML